MYNKNKLFKILSYNVMSTSHLAGLLSIIDIEKPDLIMIQENVLDTEHLSTFLANKKDYLAVSNVDENEPSKPGTALVWHVSFPVSQVTNLEPCRMQTAYVGPYPVVNVYPPAGSNSGPGRREYFREQLFRVMRGLGGKLPIMGGDWNCVIDKKDIEGGDYRKKKSQDLMDLVREFNFTDSFRYLHPDADEYTWERKDKFGSRLDRFYLPQELLSGLKEVTHHPYMSDHKYVKMLIKLPGITRKIKTEKQQETFWKLNVSVLEDEDFMLEFGVTWDRVKEKQQEYVDIAEWWDKLAKPECRALCMRFSAMKARSRRCMQDMLRVMLSCAMEEKNWVDVAFIRARLREIMRKESLGFSVRSRFKENIECEKASLYHVNREKKKGGQKTVTKLLIDNQEVEDREAIQGEICDYFGALFKGHHRRGGRNVGTPFKPDFTLINEFLGDLGQLSEASKEKIEAKVKMGELEDAIKDLQNNKSPGLDGIPAEFYKKTGSVINKELLEIINCQLDRLELVDSDKKGATRLGPKVEGVPRVDQLRPITLLNLDYKILTKILTNRLLKILAEIIKSGQSCSVPGKNILFGAHNILSVVEYVEKYGGQVALVSYDLYKAYDRLCLEFLYRVMEAMNFGEKFIDWIKMCHRGATTCFILNFLTKPIDLLMSVRQGDPMAMLLFLIYMEPLLMMIRRSIKGTHFMGERSHDTSKQMEGRLPMGEMCVPTKDEAYVDDCNLLIQDENDLLVVDTIFRNFEDLSGAILNRDCKTKIMGLGEWRGKEKWKLDWIKVESSLKIFGITFHPTYDEILEDNWRLAKEGFVKCLNAWKTRSLESIFQKVEVLKTYALPKLWYKALLLPLPGKIAGQFEGEIRRFIWKGKLEKPAFVEMCNPVDMGGLGLPCIRSKADSLLLKQLLRMLEDTEADHFNHLKFWIGNFNQHWVEMVNYPYAMRTGVIVDRPLTREAALTPHYKKLLEEFRYGEKHKYFDLFEPGNVRKVTSKDLYQLNTTTFTPPAIVYKRNVPDWQLVWDRVDSLMLEPKAREVLYMVVNNIFQTKERLYRINKNMKEENRKVWTDKCQDCDQGVVQDCVHLFMECSKVQEGWLWVRRRIMNLLQDCQGLSNFELLHLVFPRDGRVENEIVWLIGNWVQVVYEEGVVRNRKLKDQFTRGHFQFKYYETMSMKIPTLNYIQDVTVMDPG